MKVDESGGARILNGDEVASDGEGNALTIDAAVKTVLDSRP